MKRKQRGCVSSSSSEWCFVHCNVCSGAEEKFLEAGNTICQKGRKYGDKLKADNACFCEKWNLLFTKSSSEG
ncbi:hypothetical protein CDAR_99081 [Caerostris darwini]|uniref:Uncharacterized protein n=1 Tax=Caerostris darwini TaxID=1538125 RepID=A0AAV4Q3Z8_9ARAC|nr:hypothetical protein CDAR_99081 [Caerostris darwini]